MDAEREECFPQEYRHLLSARRAGIVERWYEAITDQTFSPFAAPEILACLHTLIERAIALLLAEPFDDARGKEIGTALARLRYLHSEALRQTLIVLGSGLGEAFPAPQAEALQPRIVALLGAIAAGYLAHTTTTILTEQEAIRAALLAERERISSALRESETRFRAIFANAGIGITLAGLEGHLVEWNPATERILGYNCAEMSRLLFTDITHPDDIAEDHALYGQLVGGKRDYYYKEKRYRHKHGHIVVCNLTASLLRDDQGNPQYVLGLLEDTTCQQRRSAEKPEAPYRLTERERVVLRRLAESLTQDQIAKAEDLRVRTVGRIVASLHEKLDAPSLVMLGVRAAQLSLVR